MLSISDLELKCLFGASIPLNDVCLIHPMTIIEIIGMGEDEYRRYLNLLTLTSIDLYNNYKKRGVEVPIDIDVFDNLIESCEYDELFLLDMEKAFSTFIREPVHILTDLRVIVVGDSGLDRRILKKEDFYEMQDILRIQNRIPIEEKPPENETPMQRKFRLNREKVKEAKRKQGSQEGEAVSLHDLISSLCVYDVGITLKNVGDLTIYSFHELLDRAREKDKYSFDERAVLAGADPKKVKPKFWIRKLEKQ